MLFLIINLLFVFFNNSLDTINESEFEQQLSAFKMSTGWDETTTESFLTFEANLLEQKTVVNTLNDYSNLMTHITKLSNKKSPTAHFNGGYKEFDFRFQPTSHYTAEFESVTQPIYAHACNAIKKYDVLQLSNNFDTNLQYTFQQFLDLQKKSAKVASLKSKFTYYKMIYSDIYFTLRMFDSYQESDKFNITPEVKNSFINVLKSHQNFTKCFHKINKIDIQSTSPIAESFNKLLHDPNTNYTFLQGFILVTLKNSDTLDTKKVSNSNIIPV